MTLKSTGFPQSAHVTDPIQGIATLARPFRSLGTLAKIFRASTDICTVCVVGGFLPFRASPPLARKPAAKYLYLSRVYEVLEPNGAMCPPCTHIVQTISTCEGPITLSSHTKLMCPEARTPNALSDAGSYQGEPRCEYQSQLSES